LSGIRVGTQRLPFDFAVVDEAQDITVSQLRFLAAVGSRLPNGLFFARTAAAFHLPRTSFQSILIA
jgi:hypothetical protein